MSNEQTNEQTSSGGGKLMLISARGRSRDQTTTITLVRVLKTLI